MQDKTNLTRRAFTVGGAAMVAAAGQAFGADTPALPANVTAQLSLCSNDPAIPFNRMIFGQFLEHFHRQVYGGAFEPGSPLSDKSGFRLDVAEALRELKVPIVRWPGGCFVSAYHWEDGIGKKRTPAFDKAWGVEDPNTFGTDEFIKWCQLIGAEPYICTNAGTGTFEEMSNWVEYTNLSGESHYAKKRQANGHKDPFDVKYWSIGNENYFGTEIGSKTVTEWGQLVKESAKLMRAVDSRITLLAAATVDGEWTSPLLKTAGKYLNYISIHGYWDFLWDRGTKPADYLECMMRSEKPEDQIKKAVKLINDNGFGGKIKIAFDEWNLRSWHHPGFPGGGADQVQMIKERDENDQNGTYTMADALFSASFLNGCLRHADVVDMACMAPVVNVRGPLYAHSKGIVKRTTFHVLKMYSDLLQPLVVPCNIVSQQLKAAAKAVAQVDGIVTCSVDKRRYAIGIVNRHPLLEAVIKLDGLPIQKANLTILDGDSTDAFNDVSHPNRVTPRALDLTIEGGIVKVPPHSLTFITAEI